MLEHVSCNLCGKTETRFLFDMKENMTGEAQRFPIVQCKSCGLVFVNPRPSREGIVRYYPENSYYSYRFQDETTLKRRIRNYVLEEQGGYAHSGRDRIAVRIIGKLVAQLTRSQVLLSVPAVTDGKALDVGCGCGELLLWLRQHGWSEVRGVELSSGAVRLARAQGLDVFCGDLVDARYPGGFFDLITLNQVLEHLHDPMLILREIHRILKPDGLLIVGVPNFESYENSVFRKHQSIMQEVPRHLYHFSRRTLTRMMVETGFRVRRTVGKTFFIPRVNRNSLKILLRHESGAAFLRACVRLSLERPLRYLLSREKESFGQLFAFYAEKK